MNDFSDKIKDITTDAIKYWEKCRILYNLVLIIIVSFFFNIAELSIHNIFSIFLLAVIANICYTVIYVVDFFVQLSAFQEKWRKIRWILFGAGTFLASVLAVIVSGSMFHVI